MKSSPTEAVVGRFAPSPTGPLHAGSLLVALASWCSARQQGGRWLLRIEDIDTPRVVPGAETTILHDLERYGLTWDGPVLRQSERKEAYEAALDTLRDNGDLYPCGCSRREILASAPHPGEEGPVYPGTCRNGLSAGRAPRAWRLRLGDAPVTFDDRLYGPVVQNPATEVGDFVLKRADGIYAYQLAVVVDDAACGVTEVVRGRDLLCSTPRQIVLQRRLQLPTPNYLHLPLILGADGEKLSKRHGALTPLPGPGALLAMLFAFLGIPPPADAAGSRPEELLAWGVKHFSPAAIDRRDRMLLSVA